MRWGRSLWARRNSGPLCAYSQASWDSPKEDARLARETWPPSRRAGSVRLGAGVGEEPLGGTEPGAPSQSARGVAPGPAVCFPDARFAQCKENPGRRTSAAAGEAGVHWASSRGALSFSTSVLFIPALPSLHCPLDRRAFFLSLLVLSSGFFCMITFLPA